MAGSRSPMSRKLFARATPFSPGTSGAASSRQFIDGQPRADLLGPGHPLLDAVVDATMVSYSAVLASGSILCDRTDGGESPRLLAALRMEVVDGHEPPRSVLKRFGYVELYADGQPREGAADAPYLDYDALDAAELDLVRPLLGQSWIAASQDLALDRKSTRLN